MAWVRLDDQFRDHPKVIAAGPLASWLYICGLTYSAQFLTDGHVPARQVRRLADVDNPDELAATLVDVGLWEPAEDGFTIHDWSDYQPSSASIRTTREARSEAGRRGGLRSGETRASHINEANEEANTKQFASPGLRADAKQNRTPYPSPYPSVDPDPSEDPQRSTSKEARSTTEPAAVAAAPPPKALLLLVAKLPGWPKETVEQTCRRLQDWQHAYPELDVGDEIRRAALWLEEHEKRRASPMFLENWFKKARHPPEWEGNRNGRATPAAAGRSAAGDYTDAWERAARGED